MANAIDLRDKFAFLLVTGASKGIGAKMAIEVSRNFRSGSVVVLLARSETGLEKTKTDILECNPDIKVVTKSIDLTKISEKDLQELAKESCKNSEEFELMMMIHNVGTLGDVSKWARDIDDLNHLESYFSTNVFTPIILNNFFLKTFANTKKFIINITSKAATSPFKSFGFYCAGKAAREMFFRVLAEESPDILVLNYSPGPVETKMTEDAQANAISSETSAMFKALRDTSTILTTDQTTKKFLEIIADGNFKSGDHVDFYD